jgi:hypothetical protein
MRRVAQLGTANTPELRDHYIGYYFSQMISRPCGGSYDWVQQTTQSFNITILKFFIKHKVQSEF